MFRTLGYYSVEDILHQWE